MSDAQLLSAYAEQRSEIAFRELVRRHMDFVHSAALRMVRDPHLAQDVAQGVFLALARQAGALAEHAVLAGWLHRTAQNLAAQTVRTDVRRRQREQEAVAMNALPAAPEASWDELAPHLDAALGELSDTDRDAVLLRYFEQQSAREMAARLGLSEEAAQKRVSRAVERLRELLAQRKVSLGASGLVGLITANAVQAAPAGLAVSLSSAVLTSATVSTVTTTASTAPALTMTILQKACVVATLAVLAGAGLHQAQQNAKLREQVATLRQQQVPLAEQVRQLEAQLASATNRLGALIAENERLSANSQQREILRLRGEIGLLRNQPATVSNAASQTKQPLLATARAYYDRAGDHYIHRDYEAQLEDLDKAIELDPNMAEAYFMRGNLYASNLPERRGGYERAMADYTRCLEIKPNDAGARWNRAMHYPSMRRYDDAIADWTTYIEGDTDFSLQGEGKAKSLAGAHFYRARVYQSHKKDYHKAIADYTAALAIDPQIQGAHRLRGECYEKLGEVDKAQLDFAIEPKRE